MGSKHSLTNWLKIADVVLAGSSFFVLAVASIPGLELQTISQFLALRISVSNALLFVLLLGAWHLSLLVAGVYERNPQGFGLPDLPGIAKGTLFGTAFWMLGGAAFDISFITVEFLVRVWAAIALAMVGMRWLWSAFLFGRRRTQSSRNILVVGINPRALRIARELERDAKFGCRIVGFVDDTSMACYPLVSTLPELPDFLRNNPIHEVIVCLPVRSRFDQIRDVVDCCDQQGITVKVAADVLGENTDLSSVEQIGIDTLFSLYPHAISGTGAVIKRLIDVSVSALLVVLLAPVFIVSTLAVILSSAGPVFFLQDRVGRNKQIFRMIKFRTMVADAATRQQELEDRNEAEGPVFKIKDDPRITPVGKLLRRTSIDELPQLFNVLKGEMSLVGPRPLPVRDYEGFSEDWHRRRFSVRPGISGLWQVTGRSNLPFDQWMELDLKYINEWSLALDLKVMLQTVPAVVKGTGAT